MTEILDTISDLHYDSSNGSLTINNTNISNGSPINDDAAPVFQQDGISNLSLGIPITIINGCLLYILYSLKGSLNWKRFACTLNLAVSDFFCGIVLILRGIGKLYDVMGVLEEVLDLELCTNILLTIINYNCSLFIFYLAIKKPLYYQTRLTLYKILLLIGAGWIVVLIYTTFKAIIIFTDLPQSLENQFSVSFRAVDVTVMGLSLTLNTAFYVYLLKVATIKRKESLRRRRLSEKLPSVSSISSNGSNDSETNLISLGQSSSTLALYNSVIGLGIYLLTYISTVSPLFVFWIFMLFCNCELSENLKLVNVALEAFWFARAVLDPVTFLLRERRLLSVFKPIWAHFR